MASNSDAAVDAGEAAAGDACGCCCGKSKDCGCGGFSDAVEGCAGALSAVASSLAVKEFDRGDGRLGFVSSPDRRRGGEDAPACCVVFDGCDVAFGDVG